MNILITGGSGYLGTHIKKFYDAEDLSRRSGSDILNVEDTRMARNFDVVIHLAALLDKSPESAEQVFLSNVSGTLNVLHAMKKGSTIIFASTKDVYGRFAGNHRVVPETCQTLYAGQSAFEWSKLIAERYIEFYAAKLGLRSCIFRLSNVYAPNTRDNKPGFVGHYAGAVKDGIKIHLPEKGRPVRDILHVDDLTAACSAFQDSVIEHGLYNIGGGLDNAISLADLINKLEELTGRTALVDDNGMPAPVPLNYISDISLASQEIDWEPKISIDEGLKTLL